MKIDRLRNRLSVQVINLLGSLILITAMVLSLIWYDWKLALLIYMALLGNNFERRK